MAETPGKRDGATLPGNQGTGTIDLDAYFERIGYDGSRSPTLSTLTALQVSHLASIPFENIDVRLGRRVSLELTALESKLVGARRGGYCFEQNSLFAAVLRQMEFAVSTLEARVRPPGATVPLPRTHMTLRVVTGEGSWLADVGFGGDGPLEPVALDGSASGVPGAEYRIVVEPQETHVLQLRSQDKWRDLYAFALTPALPVDFAVANHFTSTHPESIFLRTLTVQRSTPQRRHILRSRTYIERGADGEHTRELRDEEVPGVLREAFGLDLADAEVFRALGERPSS